jgi:hypothetical protein
LCGLNNWKCGPTAAKYAIDKISETALSTRALRHRQHYARNVAHPPHTGHSPMNIRDFLAFSTNAANTRLVSARQVAGSEAA